SGDRAEGPSAVRRRIQAGSRGLLFLSQGVRQAVPASDDPAGSPRADHQFRRCCDVATIAAAWAGFDPNRAAGMARTIDVDRFWSRGALRTPAGPDVVYDAGHP